ncbi:MAG TPA: AarF/UbiB family protein [Kofleriaceae bacterium]|nr:AarF/UbiB family protein [Kofleriaceae bacterium]
MSTEQPSSSPPPPPPGGDLAAAARELARALAGLARPLRDTAAQTARLVQHVGVRLDAFTVDLARDLGAVSRDAQALVNATRDQAGLVGRATPRATRLATAAAGILARHRWLRVRAAARGAAGLSADDHRALARKVVAVAAELRGGVAKVGQLASCRPDLVGPVWAAELAALQDEVPPVDAAAIRARIEAELGRPIAEVFAELDDQPLAAASLAQVHAARLLDGTPVVVKVQVPGIEDVIAADVAALTALAGAVGDVPGMDVPTLTAELSRALAAELDYRAEAAMLERFAAAEAHGGAQVPRPIAAASSGRVLTMTRLDGERLTACLERLEPAARDRVLAELVGEVAAQVLRRGLVHADPHPGNFLVTAGGHLALVDFGCVLELDARERAAYARLVLAIASGDRAAVVARLADAGFAAAEPERLATLAASMVAALTPGTSAAELDWQGAFAEQVGQARTLGGLVIPRSFVLLGRVLAAIAGLLARYRPAIHVHALVAPHLVAAAAQPPPGA